MVFATFGRILYDSSAINLVDSGWEHFTQSHSPMTFQVDLFTKKVSKLARVFSGKMLIEADETKRMLNTFMLCERFAITRILH